MFRTQYCQLDSPGTGPTDCNENYLAPKQRVVFNMSGDLTSGEILEIKKWKWKISRQYEDPNSGEITRWWYLDCHIVVKCDNAEFLGKISNIKNPNSIFFIPEWNTY